MKNFITRYYRVVRDDSLYRNSIYLMLGTAIMTFLGFFFWIIVARLFTSEQVGIGTTLISIITLISGFSFLGLGTGLIRYLPSSDRKSRKINTSFTLVSIMAVLVAVIYLAFMKTFSPVLLFVRDNIIYSILFIIFAVFLSLNTLVESVFIAYRSSKFVLVSKTVFSVTKLILPLFLVALGGFGIFISMGVATSLAFIVSVAILMLIFKFSPRPLIDTGVVKKMIRLSLANYFSSLIAIAPINMLPIFITNIIGAKFSAYFYMDMMIANVLYIIPTSTTTSLFAEGSHNELELKLNLRKAAKIISLIIIPAILITVFLGKYFLLAFGREYSDEGFILLRYLAASGIFISINAAGVTILNIKQRIGLIILTSFINPAIIIGLSVLLLKTSSLGIVGVGIAWITGQAATSIIHLSLFKRIINS